ncbi:MAG: hypothetical protein JXR91_05235 [Deltaproteobacteria bacterium]|nr:hypothetical protein [Deltaproteobacteria bacterium]
MKFFNLSKSAVIAGVAAWMTLFSVFVYFKFFYIYSVDEKHSILAPGLFETMIAFFTGAVFASIGLSLALVAIKQKMQAGVAVAAIIINSVYLVPVILILIWQILLLLL